MTVIAWDGKTLAADKRTTIDNSYHITTTKLVRIKNGPYKGCIVGACGTTVYCKCMFDWLENGAKKEDLPSFQDSQNDSVTVLLINLDGKIMRLDCGYIFYEVEESFHAIGSGRDYAIATMHLGHDAVKAVEVASNFCNTCGNGIDTLTLE